MMKRFVTIGMLVTVATLFGEVSFSALNIGGAEYVTGVTHPEFRAATNALWQAKQDKLPYPTNAIPASVIAGAEWTTTNDVNAIIASSNLCTVAAAQAMTNGTVSSALEIKNATGAVQFPRKYRFADNDGEGAGIGRLCLFQGYHVVQKCAWVSDVDYLSTIVAGKQDALSDVQVAAIGRISLDPSSAEWMFNGTANSASKLHVTGAPLTDYDIQFFGNDELKWGRTNGRTHDYIAFHSDLSSFAPKLTGRTYDFANGSNFTMRLYTALTNVIQTLGGTVTNPPIF